MESRVTIFHLLDLGGILVRHAMMTGMKWQLKTLNKFFCAFKLLISNLMGGMNSAHIVPNSRDFLKTLQLPIFHYFLLQKGNFFTISHFVIN